VFAQPPTYSSTIYREVVRTKFSLFQGAMLSGTEILPPEVEEPKT